MCYGGGAQRTLPVSTDSQDGAMGEEGFHTHPATSAGNEAASVPVWAQQVSYICTTLNCWNDFDCNSSVYIKTVQSNACEAIPCCRGLEKLMIAHYYSFLTNNLYYTHFGFLIQIKLRIKTFILFNRSRGSSVSVVSAYGLDDRGSIPGRSKGFFSNLCVWLWGQTSLLYTGYQGQSTAGVWRWPLTPSSSKVEHE
jgi:hypothetical protein